MQAKEFYSIGLKAYCGDAGAASDFFEKLAAVVIPIAKIYAVLPSYAMAKIVVESGYMTNEWNKSAEALSGKKMKRKAQDYNNIYSMNCFAENQKYLEYLPLPEWTSYRDTFGDWGPHGNDEESLIFKFEPWKAYKSIEDAVEDWCANIRYQAAVHGFRWHSTDLMTQLLATESFTPEGSSACVRDGLHYEWQETIMKLYEAFELWKYDKEAEDMAVKTKITAANLDAHIEQAYKYAQANCVYGRTDTNYPPGEPLRPGEKGAIDCVGLVFRAFYTMNRFPRMISIDQVAELCAGAGMVRSENPEDVWKHHGVVCMQDLNNRGTQHVNHVYYSLGGSSVSSISKFDLGSNERIQARQPFSGGPVNEWTDRRLFLCMYYIDEKTHREDVPSFEPHNGVKASVLKNTGLYAGPGTAWRKEENLKAGIEVTAYQYVTNDKGNLFRIVKTDGGIVGYASGGALRLEKFKAYSAEVRGTDGNLSLRVGAGGGCYKIADIPEGDIVHVDGRATAGDGSEWLHVKWKGKRGFVASRFLWK